MQTKIVRLFYVRLKNAKAYTLKFAIFMKLK